MNTKKMAIVGIILLLFAAVGFFFWNKAASPTKIALLNFQKFQTGGIIRSNTDKFVKYESISLDELDKLKSFDFVLAFGMGLNITEEQREYLKHLADKEIKLHVFAATNPANNISNLDSLQKEDVSDYISNANSKNYLNLGRYVRKYIDGKTFFVNSPDGAVESPSDVFYHIDQNQYFNRVEEYEEYLKKNNFYTQGGRKVALLGGLNDPFSGNKDNIDSLIVSFQRAGMNVYPIESAMQRLELLQQVGPDAVIYFAHGRLAMGQGDRAVKWLKEQNIPLFGALNLLETEEEWLENPNGMFGGFMSQSIVMPELDGAIYPYVISSQEPLGNGAYAIKAIPERLASFTQIVSNFMSLKQKDNAEKKVSIYYFKGPGKESLTAQGLETVPSLYNLLKRLKKEGYRVDNLPATEKAFEELLMSQGAILSPYADGVFDDYLKTGNPALIDKSEYESWVAKSLPKDMYAEVTDLYGAAPGDYMAVSKGDKEFLAVARIELGNIALLPQAMAGLGDDSFAIVHGAKMAPPHTYIGSYLWSSYAFKADAILHFGTHGSLEFTPHKQLALSNYDWADRLLGSIPHFYYYTIGNVGESMMAKRRSYATTVSYLTPPFIESGTRTQYSAMQNKIRDYFKTDQDKRTKIALEVKKLVVELGFHRSLRLDSTLTIPYTAEEIEKIEDFAEEIASTKVTGKLFVTGEAYSKERIRSSVLAMSADPIAYSLAALDRQRAKVTEAELKNNVFFTQRYLNPAKVLVRSILDRKVNINTALITKLSGLTEQELQEAHKILTPPKRGMAAMMAAMQAAEKAENKEGNSQTAMAAEDPSGVSKTGKMPDHVRKMLQEKEKQEPEGKSEKMPQAKGAHPQAKAGHPHGARPQVSYTKEQKEWARAVVELEQTLNNVLRYEQALLESPENEFLAMLNALSGGYVVPSSGGDAIANPRAVPTGRNLYSINAEATPSEVAWDKGVSLVNATLEQYMKQHNSYPSKVSYTFWSSEFIESEGATIAQVLYMLGVEPVRDMFGRVSDLRLIDSETLARPRIDVVVQTSGQFRDLAASRLALITKAVEMAAAAKGDKYENLVEKGAVEIEAQLVERGLSPKLAREASVKRVFGGINGMYGTGIQEMVTSSDKWEDEKEIADTYIHNMGASYGSQKEWGAFQEGLMRAALSNTDVVIQPRQSNTWGALSLDHVYEFMGGLNLAVRNVTGKDPEAYFADYRNRNNVRMQELKEAIGVEVRSTVFNPVYIKEMMQGSASSAAQVSEIATNTFGWNVMKPAAIDNEIWDEFYDVYVKDVHKLGTEEYFKRVNPAALQEISAVMLETARKGMWKATETQLKDLANLHTNLVQEFGSTGAGFSGGNEKLQDFIAQKVAPEKAKKYKAEINNMQNSPTENVNAKDGMVLKKATLAQNESENSSLNGLYVVSVVLFVFVILLFVLRRKRKKN